MNLHRRVRRLLPFVGLVIALLLVAACTPPPPSPELSPVENDVYAKHFVYRAAKGLPQLALDSAMNVHAQDAADRNANAMTSCQSPLQHTSQDDLRSWYSSGAENLACMSGCPVSSDVVWGLWLASPGHLTNIENPNYGAMGVGATCKGGFQVIAVQFRSP
jgi:uncharacterized protein YkwD